MKAKHYFEKLSQRATSKAKYIGFGSSAAMLATQYAQQYGGVVLLGHNIGRVLRQPRGFPYGTESFGPGFVVVARKPKHRLVVCGDSYAEI